MYKYRYSSILRMCSIFGWKVPCQELMCLRWKQVMAWPQQIIEQLKFPTKFGRERDNSWNHYELFSHLMTKISLDLHILKCGLCGYGGIRSITLNTWVRRDDHYISCLISNFLFDSPPLPIKKVFCLFSLPISRTIYSHFLTTRQTLWDVCYQGNSAKPFIFTM